MKEVKAILYPRGGMIGTIISQTPGTLRWCDDYIEFVPSVFQAQMMAKTETVRWRISDIESINKTYKLVVLLRMKAMQIKLIDSSVWTFTFTGASAFTGYSVHDLADEISRLLR